MNMIKAFFIDVDNTLLDFDAYVYDTMQQGFRKFSLRQFEPWMADVFHVENNKLWRALEDGRITFAELQQIRWNTIFDKLGIKFDGITFETYFRNQLRESAVPVAGAYELLAVLKKRGALLCVASNGPYEQQMNRLRLAGMTGYFDYFFISEDIGFSKPSEGFFTESFRRLNEDKTAAEVIRPEDCVMLGDSLTSDMAGGRSCGMHTVFFSRGKKSPTADASPVWDEWYESLSDISDAYSI